MNLNEYLNEYKTSLKNKMPNVSIYIPKENGKPTLNGRWYIYFSYKDSSGENKPVKKYLGINRIKTVKGRLKAAKELKAAIEHFLMENDDPFGFDAENDYTISDALKYAFDEKKKTWGAGTIQTNKHALLKLLDWLQKNNIHTIPVKAFKKKYLIKYRSYLQDDLGAVTVNNHIRFIKNIFGKLSQDDIIDFNIAADLQKLKEKPTKNKTYNIKQLKQIKAYLLENDMPLYHYIQFLSYTFLRPIELNRLEVGNIDLDKRQIFIENTKTGTAIVPIIDKLWPTIEALQLDKYNKTDILFTPKGYPYDWRPPKGETIRYIRFKEAFWKVKKEFGFGHEYGLYSFKHTFAKLLYNKYLADGMTDLQAKHKLMTITRHKSLSSLNKYLRNIGAFVPDDYSDDFTFDF